MCDVICCEHGCVDNCHDNGFIWFIFLNDMKQVHGRAVATNPYIFLYSS